MNDSLQRALASSLGKGYRISEEFSPTSVALQKKRFFFKSTLYVWLDKSGRACESRSDLRELAVQLSETIGTLRIASCKQRQIEALKRATIQPSDEFGQMLLGESSETSRMRTELEEGRANILDEIESRAFFGIMGSSLRREVWLCLERGYEIKEHSSEHAILKRSSRALTGVETLHLRTDVGGGIAKVGEGNETLQNRLDSLISVFTLYRAMRPTPGRHHQVLDKQFELDAEINALHAEMKYLGYHPHLGDFRL